MLQKGIFYTLVHRLLQRLHWNSDAEYFQMPSFWTCTSQTTENIHIQEIKEYDKNKKRYVAFPTHICSIIFVTGIIL